MPRQYDFGFEVRPSLRLSRIEEILQQTRIVDPLPSRQTLINLIEDGTLDGKKTNLGYLVYEDSFKSWVRSLQPEAFELFIC